MDGFVVQLSIKPRVAGEHGLPKRPVSELDIAAGGAAGDYNHYRTRKLAGDPDQAILLVTQELLVQLNGEGWAIGPGDFGENITLGGITEQSLQPGVRLTIGPVELEVTRPCDPCEELYTLPAIGQERGAAFLRATVGRRGWYARVLGAGRVTMASPVRVDAPRQAVVAQ